MAFNWNSGFMPGRPMNQNRRMPTPAQIQGLQVVAAQIVAQVPMPSAFGAVRLAQQFQQPSALQLNNFNCGTNQIMMPQNMQQMQLIHPLRMPMQMGSITSNSSGPSELLRLQQFEQAGGPSSRPLGSEHGSMVFNQQTGTSMRNTPLLQVPNGHDSVSKGNPLSLTSSHQSNPSLQTSASGQFSSTASLPHGGSSFSQEALQSELQAVTKDWEDFTQKYNDWEKSYDSWLQQNQYHPDKQQYEMFKSQWQQYEQEMDLQRCQILEKKENLEKQLRQRQGVINSVPAGSLGMDSGKTGCTLNPNDRNQPNSFSRDQVSWSGPQNSPFSHPREDKGEGSWSRYSQSENLPHSRQGIVGPTQAPRGFHAFSARFVTQHGGGLDDEGYERDKASERPAEVIDYGHGVTPGLSKEESDRLKRIGGGKKREEEERLQDYDHPRGNFPRDVDHRLRDNSGSNPIDYNHGRGSGRDARGPGHRDVDHRLGSGYRGDMGAEESRDRNMRGSRLGDERRDDWHREPHGYRSGREEGRGVAAAAAAPEPKPETVVVTDLLEGPGRASRPDAIVVILRGLPGSGKTYLAKLIRDRETENGGQAPRILCLDDYFTNHVEKMVKDPDTGRRVKKLVEEYEHESELEDTYRASLIKSFKKTVDDRHFPLIILDAVNDKINHFQPFWSYAKSKGFQVYVASMQCDNNTCATRNVHDRSLNDIEKLHREWEKTPVQCIRLDIRPLLQDVSIQQVEMDLEGDDNGEENAVKEGGSEPQAEAKQEDEEEAGPESWVQVYSQSKWEQQDTTNETLNKLDGVSRRRKRESSPANMDEFLGLESEQRGYDPTRKRVRWADLEELEDQNRKRQVGFVLGQTDWDKMTASDDHLAQTALNKTKYI